MDTETDLPETLLGAIKFFSDPDVALAFVAKTGWFYTFTQPPARRLVTSARAMWAGLRGDFTGHLRFIGG